MSEREFSKTSPSKWRDRRFTSLESDGRVLADYFRSSPHHNAAGCYRVTDAYAADDLVWEVERYTSNRELLVEAGLILFDAETSEVYLVDWFDLNKPVGLNQAKHCAKEIRRITSAALRERVQADFDTSMAPEKQNSGPAYDDENRKYRNKR